MLVMWYHHGAKSDVEMHKRPQEDTSGHCYAYVTNQYGMVDNHRLLLYG